MNHQGVTFEVVTIKFEVDYDGIVSEDETFTTLPQQIELFERQALEMATRITEKHLELDPDELERLHITVTDIDRRTLPDGEELQHDPRSWGILDMGEKLDFKKLKP